jgi:arylsulfatase
MPTIFDAVGIPQPTTVNGIAQVPWDGVSMVYTWDKANAEAPSTRKTQYFEILGNRAIYHDGWVAACFHGRVPWIRSGAVPFDAEHETWELYDVRNDFSQAVDLAREHPDRLAELRLLFDEEARQYGVYPLSDETVKRALPHNRPSLLEGVTTFTLHGDSVRLPELASVNVKNTSFDITASLQLQDAGADGVIICQGGNMAGWSLYLQDGRPIYHYNLYGHEHVAIAGPTPLPPGRVELKLSFEYDGGGLGKGGTARLLVDGAEVARGRIERTVPFLFSMSGETLDVGVDTGAPVGPYPSRFPFTGEIEKVVIEIRPQLPGHDAQAFHEGQLRGALRSQ